jgi:hypothetical protein
MASTLFPSSSLPAVIDDPLGYIIYKIQAAAEMRLVHCTSFKTTLITLKHLNTTRIAILEPKKSEADPRQITQELGKHIVHSVLIAIRELYATNPTITTTG